LTRSRRKPLTCANVEPVTGIEPAYPARQSPSRVRGRRCPFLPPRRRGLWSPGDPAELWSSPLRRLMWCAFSSGAGSQVIGAEEVIIGGLTELSPAHVRPTVA